MRAFLRDAASRVGARRETGPLDTVEALTRFAHTRAAFVAQKKLYGYLKARMGTRYPSMFEDDVFVTSINVAKWHVFAACLSDITVYTVARVVCAGDMTREEGRALATHCHEAGLAANREQLAGEDMVAAWHSAFFERLARAHWTNLAAGAECFTESPKALYRWAPIEEGLKRYDREIVENSIRYAWAEITRDFRKRGVPLAIAADWRAVGDDEQIATRQGLSGK